MELAHPITSLLSTLADPSRIRLLRILERAEVSVSELVAITGLPQPRVSTHLSKLKSESLVTSRREGPCTMYCASRASMPAGAEQILAAVHATPESGQERADRSRLRAVVASRTRTRDWPDEVAGRMEEHYSPGRTWEATARGLIGLVQLGRVLDVGSGDGVLAHLLAGQATHVTCLDRSPHVIEAARARLHHRQNLCFDVGDMHALPYDNASFDCVLLMHVLTYAHDPSRVLDEAARVLTPGGTLTAATLAPHDHPEVSTTFGHVNTGLAPEQLQTLALDAGLVVDSCEISSRERIPPFFSVVTLHAAKR